MATMDPMSQAGLTPHGTFIPQQTQGHVLCCLCGTAIPPNPSNMCVGCIRTQVDITEGMQKQVNILWCKECNRYLQPPKNWLRAELESKELLTFCIKRIKGLGKVKLVDAGFIWTEPHSRRLKVKLTIQAEVFNGAILQQGFVVDYIVEPHMCPDCARHAANPNSWSACVQVRQHVEHKRTFFYLEQLILKHNADANCLSVKEMHEGVDFYMANRSHALKFVDFLQSVVPIRFRHDRQLVSHDTHSQTYNYKYTFSVEIVPVCRDDLVCIPQKLAGTTGNLGPLVLCTRVTSWLSFIDFSTLRSTNIEAPAFWRTPFTALLSSKQLVEFVVLDIEPLGPRSNKWASAEAQVAKASDFGSNDKIFFTKTHLGNVLNPGDVALGYDLTTAQWVDPDMERYVQKGLAMPDVVLVRKSYDEKRRRRRTRGEQRPWKLKRMAIDAADIAPSAVKRGADRGENDLEQFMQELEEDPEMRSKVALYRDPQYDSAAVERARQEAMTDDDDEGDLPQVPLDELLDDLAGLQLDEPYGESGDEEEDGGDAGTAERHSGMRD